MALDGAAVIYRCVVVKRIDVPLMASSVAAGFPSPADDYLDRPLDFNELLIARPAATFAVRVTGDSMRDAGILPNDIAVVDRSITPASGCTVLAIVDTSSPSRSIASGEGGSPWSPRTQHTVASRSPKA